MNNTTQFLINLFYKTLSKKPSGKKPGVVFDIDGTLIVDGITKPENKDEIIHSVYNFCLYLQSHNIPIFVITARQDTPDVYNFTHNVLHDMGIFYDRLYLWNTNHFDTHDEYKENARKTLQNNYNIIMSLGDNTWDYGKYGGVGVHIHNDGEYFTIH